MGPGFFAHFVRLNNLIHDYETEYGPLSTGPSASTRIRPGQPPAPLENSDADKKAAHLFQLIKNLNVQTGIERSFKISQSTVLSNRFLLGFKKDTIKGDPHDRILNTCKQMGMPKDLLKAFNKYLPDARYIHFGFEGNERTCVYKAYLEFYDKIEKEMKLKQNTPEHCLMHLGFKWDLSDKNRKAVTRYIWDPSGTAENTIKNLSDILRSDQHQRPLEITKGILDVALQRIPYHDILTLDVTEEGNPRKSLDINIYQAKLQLSELYPFLLDMFRYYSIPPDQFYRIYNQIKSRTFGHISSGIDRQGKDFLTIYYGVEGLNENNAETTPLEINPPLTSRAIHKNHKVRASDFIGVERTDEKAGKLFQILNSLKVQIGFERSFKVLKNNLLTDRFLAGFNRNSITEKSHEKIMNICQQIEMPEDFMETFQENLPDSNIVLFGFEGNENNRIYKAYLEFGQKISEEIKKNQDNPESFLIHMGFKWDVSDNSQKTRAEYTCFPSYTIEDILGRLANTIYTPEINNPFRIAKNVITIGASRVEPGEFLYFEAKESDNPRTSFDINMYRANLQMTEIYPMLLDMMRYYSIPENDFHKLYKRISPLIFGHLTGGIDREGKDFLTVYFGEKGSTR